MSYVAGIMAIFAIIAFMSTEVCPDPMQGKGMLYGGKRVKNSETQLNFPVSRGPVNIKI